MTDTDSTEDGIEALAAAAEGNEAELARLLDRLDDVNELLDVLALATAAADDEMVEGLAATGTGLGAVADAAAEPETARGLESLLHAVGDAAGDPGEPPPEVGLVGLLRATRDPEVRAGLGFLIALSRSLGRDLTRRADGRSAQVAAADASGRRAEPGPDHESGTGPSGPADGPAAEQAGGEATGSERPAGAKRR